MVHLAVYNFYTIIYTHKLFAHFYMGYAPDFDEIIHDVF